MKNPQEILELLTNQFKDLKFELKTDQPVDPVLICDPLKIDEICHYLANSEELLFDNLMNLSGVDDFNGQKTTDENGNSVYSGGTFSVHYNIESSKYRHKITLKVSVSRDNPRVNSVINIWNSANWHEREAYDMFGIVFINHPDLRRILLPYDWEAGYPLRKDYENPEFYQGMKVPY
ncbi:MAG: NADH-quinone oxidoreductase subunit C [Ignavibacteriaceae bacterium]|nr:NADH-quinone oxidoreductase subunit C [Ignavibacteriaceae bacterium]